MIHFAARTCTIMRKRRREITSSKSHDLESQPLASFRGEAVYVLLGPPGSGKTEAFRREAEREHGLYITARNFITFNFDPEWERKTLFIDGLDEMRAGATDRRTPFDAIRRKLHCMSCPRLRLSCREADWFGATDRERLEEAMPHRNVQVLRLDPLSDQGVLEILERNHGVEDPAAFVAVARERGVASLLSNPQNLRMLTEAVDDAGDWPRTKTETFDMACRKLVSEKNHDHRIALPSSASTQALMDGAGHLCALLLLAGKDGVTLPGTASDGNYPDISGISIVDRSCRVVATNLFASQSEGRMVPVHRHVAEFVAARYLANLIAGGLPVCRILSLMTGFDGGVISEFRGLAAWLAVCSKPAREALIRRDPIGVVRYGDAETFSVYDKAQVFRALRAETVRNPWLASQIPLDSLWGRLVDPCLEPELNRALADPARDEAHQSFVLLILAAISSRPVVPGVGDTLMAIVRDTSWPTMHRCAAVEAYAQNRRRDHQGLSALQSLINDVYSSKVPTLDDDLLGTLLTELYPDELTPCDLVGFLRKPAQSGHFTRYVAFWLDGLIKSSTVAQMAQLLDLLRTPMKKARTEAGNARPHVNVVGFPAQVPLALLRHLLENAPESVSRKQVLHWLDFAGWIREGQSVSFVNRVTNAEFFSNWLGAHPEIQKAIIEKGANRCPEAHDPFRWMHRVKQSLFEATLPPDYAVWCADQALIAGNGNIARWFVGEAAAFIHYQFTSDAPEKKKVACKLQSDARLLMMFEKILLVHMESQDQLMQQDGSSHSHPLTNDGRFDELRKYTRANVSTLRANQCLPALLNHLAMAYLDNFLDVRGETPEDRLRCLLGPDDTLLCAARTGLRGAIHRTDLPTWIKILELADNKQTHLLAYPFMIGLDECSRTENEEIQLTEHQIRLGLSIHLAVPRLSHMHSTEHPPRWLCTAVAKRADVVATTWSYCVRRQLRKGVEILPDTYPLSHAAAYAPLASKVSLPILSTFPVRCRARQLSILKDLLHAALRHADKAQLLKLIEEKLACKSMNSGQKVYWLAAGLFARSEIYGERLVSYVSGKRRALRICRLMEMTLDPRSAPLAMSATTLKWLVHLIGPHSSAPPRSGEIYSVTLPIQAHHRLCGFIDRLAEDASLEAMHALESLASDDRLVNWRPMLLDRLHKQMSILRKTTYQHPTLEQVAEVLDNGPPANAADLWALTVDVLHQISEDIRNGATSDWHQYWNVDRYDRPEVPKPENACRNALLSKLEQALAPFKVDSTGEGSYADSRRSDIRISIPGYNIPIEIKRSCHAKLWSSVNTQLIDMYTRDPDTDGYGIYLVFWFGEAIHCKPKLEPASKRKPQSPEELREALVDRLNWQERRKIAVCVIDVSNPRDQTEV